MPLLFQKLEFNFKMKNYITLFTLFLSLNLLAQKKAEDFGFKQFDYIYKKDKVAVIVHSKKGEENNKKPLFFFCLGSLPRPLIITSDDSYYPILPFNSDRFIEKYHVVIVQNPEIPVVLDESELANDFSYINEKDTLLTEYNKRNYLDYYVDRNNYIIKKLCKENWVDKKNIIVAGHSQGASVSAKMAYKNKKIAKLIYSGGNPYGRILNIVENNLYYEHDSTKINSVFDIWKRTIANKDELNLNGGDTYKATYSFSYPVGEYILKLKIPVLVSSGLKDWSSPFVNLLHVECIKKGKTNITFNNYIGLNHNYFPVNENLKPNYDVYNWDNVGNDWLTWLTN